MVRTRSPGCRLQTVKLRELGRRRAELPRWRNSTKWGRRRSWGWSAPAIRGTLRTSSPLSRSHMASSETWHSAPGGGCGTVRSRAKRSGSDSTPAAESWPSPVALWRRYSAPLPGSLGRQQAWLSMERGTPKMSCRGSSLLPSPAWDTSRSRRCGWTGPGRAHRGRAEQSWQ